MRDFVLISSFILLTFTGDHCVRPLKGLNKALVFTDSQDKATSLVDLTGGSFTSETFLFHFGIQTPASIDYVPNEDRVYWSDIRQGMILSALSNGTSLKVLFSCDVISPLGIVIDMAGSNLFWTDSGTKRIEVGRLDGSKRKVLISVDTDKPKAIILDIPHGFMYWTDVGKKPKIERAAMDGTARQIIVNKNLGLPTGLAMDHTTNRLYWIDAKLDRIEEFDLKTRNRKVILIFSTDVSPFALTMYQGWLYWSDWQAKSILRVSVTGGNTEVVVTGLKRPMDLFVYDSASSDPSPCSIRNGLCSDFCLLTPTGYKCACSAGVTLLPDGKNCDYESFNKASSEKFLLFAGSHSGKIYKIPLAIYATPCFALEIGRNITYPIAVDYDPVEDKIYWTDGRLRAIVRAFLDGSSVEVVAQHDVKIPDGMAIDWIGRNLYWSDAGTKRIEVSKLDGSYRRSLFTKDIDKPRSIALDMSGRNMFWTDWGSSPKIERANMDGTARTVLVNSGIVWINAVALDIKNKFLYWCDARLDRIERIDFQGNNRKVVFLFHNPVGGGFFHQFGLAVDGHILYWTDWVRKSVIKYNSNSGFLSFEAEWKGIIRPMGLHLYDSKKFHKAVKCQSLSAPPNGILQGCEGNTTEDYLTTCRFSCFAGYKGTGSEVRTCLKNSSWSGQGFSCRGIRCPHLTVPLKAILLSPSCGNLYGANCVFGCHYGYASNGGNVTRTCSLSGKWSGRPINCTDVLPPSFGDTCPSKLLLIYTKSAQFSAVVNWTVPAATDNAGILPEVSSNSQHPPQKMAEGVHVIIYTATDMSGNKEFCSITIKVAVIYCTSMNVQSEGPLRMSNCGNYNGAECNFSCAVGYRLNGSSITKCVAPGNRPPGIWSNNMPSCEVIRCHPLPSPINGSKTGCSSYIADVYGTQCTFFCNAGYYLTGSSVRHCIENGTWSGRTSACKAIECDALVAPKFGALSPASCLSRSRFGQECIFTCQDGYTLEGTVLRVCADGGNWTGENSTICKDLSPPTFNHSCPGNMVFYTGKCDNRAAVSWSDPVATDNAGTTVMTYPAIRPPTNLTVGLYEVLYTTTDKSGNSAICSFAVQVARISCPNLHPPRNGILNSLSCGSFFGSHATLSCNTGYQLSGSHFRSCLLNGTWSGKTTVCNAVRCPSIQSPANGDVSPDVCRSQLGAQYEESCVFTCNSSNGYQLQGPQNVSCQGNGSWSADIKQTFCKDIQRPYLKCPADIEVDTDANQSYATVNWTVPVPTDNSNKTFKAIGLYPPQKIQAGRKEVAYSVEDSAGLRSSCKFTIHVKDTEPPRILNCPSKVQIVSGKRWSKIVLPPSYHTDNVGVTVFTTSIRNGSGLTWGEYNITYTVSDKAGNTAECPFHMSIASSSCKDLPAPLNGAKACEMWLAGMHCTVHCNKGFGFSTAPKALYFCVPKGQWINAKVEGEEKPAFPDCSREHNPKDALVNGQIHYLTEECGDEESKRIVARNFITVFKQHPFGLQGGCLSNEKCTIENVRVECGSRARQRRESLERKKTSKLYLQVTFTIKVPLPNDINSSQDFNKTSLELSKTIAAEINEMKLDLNISDVILQVDRSVSPVISIAGFACDKGQVRRKDRCVNCPVGHFHNASVSSCQTCPADHYQDKEAQSSCIPCPKGTFTHGKEVSKSRHDCRACPKLGEPFKGYKICSKASGRTVCTLYCRDGHSFDVDAETTFVCGRDTKWRWNGLKKQKLPMCSSAVSPGEIKNLFSLKFPDIQCPKSQYLKQLPYLVQRKVRKVLKNVPGCSFAGECNTQAVRTSQCNTIDEPLEIQFLVSIKKSHSALKVTIEETSEAVLFELQFTVSTGKFGISYDGNYLTADRSSLSHRSTQLKCSPGSVLNSSRKGCVACPVETFYDRENVKCKPCGPGLYQDKEGQTSCLSYNWNGIEK